MSETNMKDSIEPGSFRPSSREGKMALVLAGGGFPGWMYEIGCLSALDDFFDDSFSVCDFDIYVGTSA